MKNAPSPTKKSTGTVTQVTEPALNLAMDLFEMIFKHSKVDRRLNWCFQVGIFPFSSRKSCQMFTRVNGKANTVTCTQSQANQSLHLNQKETKKPLSHDGALRYVLILNTHSSGQCSGSAELLGAGIVSHFTQSEREPIKPRKNKQEISYSVCGVTFFFFLTCQLNSL